MREAGAIGMKGAREDRGVRSIPPEVSPPAPWRNSLRPRRARRSCRDKPRALRERPPEPGSTAEPGPGDHSQEAKSRSETAARASGATARPDAVALAEYPAACCRDRRATSPQSGGSAARRTQNCLTAADPEGRGFSSVILAAGVAAEDSILRAAGRGLRGAPVEAAVVVQKNRTKRRWRRCCRWHCTWTGVR